MRCDAAAKDFQGCAPQVTLAENPADEHVDDHGRFAVKVPNEKRRAQVEKRWRTLYTKLKEPKLTRWLTYGDGARVECVHDSLNYAAHWITKKPWFFTAEEWREFRRDRHMDERYSVQKLFTAHIFNPLDAATICALSESDGIASTRDMEAEANRAFPEEARRMRNLQLSLIHI